MALNGDLTKGQVLIWKTEIIINGGKTDRRSPVFEFQGCPWYLETTYGPNKRVSLFLKRDSMECEGNRTDDFYVDCSAHDQDEEKASLQNVTLYQRTKITQRVHCIFKCDVSILENMIIGLRSHGKLVFVLIFRGVDGGICLKSQIADKSVQTNLESELENLSESFSFLLENEELPDVELKCGDSVLAAHKSVLAARSSVFRAMFRNRMKEEISGVVDIPDVEITVLKAFLKALYSGKFPDTSDDMLPKLYTVCDKYEVLSLRKLCSERMVNCLSVDNHQNYLLLADAHNDDDLKSSVSRFICDHPEFLWLDSWTRFSDEHPKLAISVYRMRLGKVDSIPRTSSKEK